MTTQMIYAQTPYYVPTNGLVGYWPFNGNANDESGNGNNGTVNGATLTTDRFGDSNSAYSFYGNNDYVEIATNNGSFNSQTYTISFWYKTNATPYTGFYPRGIISRSNSSGSPSNVYDNYCIFEGGGSLALNYQGAGTQMNTPSGIDWVTQVNNDSWHHINVTVNSDSLKTYVDGILVKKLPYLAGITFQNYPIRIGKSNHSFWSEYNGYIDDIGIWNRALTQQEITNLYNGVNYSNSCNSVSGSLVNGLVGYWPFCGNANDQSGNGNNGTVNGATLTTDRFGNANAAYNFDGVDDYISAGNLNDYNFYLNDFTISAWFLNTDTSLSTYRIIIGKDSACFGDNGQFRAGLSPYQGCQLELISNGQVGSNLSGGIQFCQGSQPQPLIWHNIILTRTQSSASLTIDGLLIAQQINNPVIYPSSVPHNYDLFFGARKGTPSCLSSDGGINGFLNFFKGKLDDIGIWNRALTQQEITTLTSNLNVALPVLFTDFKATSYEKNTILSWSIAEEKNVKQYQIEQSNNGTDFSTIGKMDANLLTTYQFIDDSKISAPLSYYRIKAIDFNEKFKYSEIIKVQKENSSSFIKIYPSIVTGNTPIHIQHNEDNAEIMICHTTGQLVKTQRITNLTSYLDINEMSKGMYFIFVKTNNNKRFVDKLIIQ